MDPVTASVRQMYEQYPYPAGNPVNRIGSDVRLVLSYLEQGRQRRGPLRVLDAGCGRGVGMIGAATLQPDVQFLGVDISRTSLDHAQTAAAERGLRNTKFQEANLLDLSGLEVPGDGYDLIFSSGVLHHLSDPQAGLSELTRVLAPHGAIVLMLYAKHGRAELTRISKAIDLMFPSPTPLAQQVQPGRAVASLAKEHVLSGSAWAETAIVSDIEFVDRCLNVNETSYDISGLWELIESSDCRFIRWSEPADWNIENLVPLGDLRNRLLALPELDRYRFIELVYNRPGFDLIISHKENSARRPLEPADVDQSTFAVNPEVVIGTEVRNTPSGQRVESLSFTLRVREPVKIAPGPIGTSLMVLKELSGSFTGKTLIRKMEQNGVSKSDGQAIIMELCKHEVLYRPHRFAR